MVYSRRGKRMGIFFYGGNGKMDGKDSKTKEKTLP